jgi:hypothetical protein
MLLVVVYQHLPALAEESETDATARIDAEITKYAPEHRQPLERVWLLETGEDVDVWTIRLTELMAKTDRMFIVRAQSHTNGLLPTELWKWINPRSV